MATNYSGSRVAFLSGQTTATFVLFLSTSAIALSNVFDRAVSVARDVLRSIRDLAEELPRLSEFRLPPPPALLTRFVQRSVAPMLASEPEFVGGGLAYRRWR